jgi:hypothetical protein
VLALAPGLLAGLGPLCNGAWDLWAQSALLLAALACAALWLCGRLLRGHVPIPERPLLAWAAGLAVWAGLSAYTGPLPAYAVPAWHVWLGGLGILLAFSVMGEGERLVLERSLRVLAWALVLLALAQRFGLGLALPPASLLNPNVFAGAILLLLPPAVARRDWVLSALLLLCLFWSRSAGAWLGLAAAVMLVHRRGWRTAAAAAAASVCVAVLWAKVGTADLSDRWVWWTAAARMAWARPWLGFGPGTFAYVLPAYADPGRPLGSLFAHQHFLETAAALGWPFLAAWLAGLWSVLRNGSASSRVACLALLIHSLWDYSLSIPAVLWLFCGVAGSCLPRSRWGVDVPARWRLPACAAVLAAASWAGAGLWSRWQAERERVRAEVLIQERGPDQEALALLGLSARRCDHPETARLSGLLQAALSGGSDETRLQAAVADFERAAAQNPFRASTWSLLESVYRRLGREDLARAARHRGAAALPALREHGEK